MDVLYRNQMLDSIPTPINADVHFHSDDPGAGNENHDTTVSTEGIEFVPAVNSARALRARLRASVDATTIKWMTVWDGPNRVTSSPCTEITLSTDDEYVFIHTYSLL